MDKEVYWIVSHNTRIQCLLNKMNNLPVGTKKIRLKNCAIIRIELSNTIKIQMLYSGELEDSEKHKIFKSAYYVAKKDLPSITGPPPMGDDDDDEDNEINDRPEYIETESHALLNDPYKVLKPVRGGVNWKNPFSRAPTPVTPETEKISREQALDIVINTDVSPETIDELKRRGDAESVEELKRIEEEKVLASTILSELQLDGIIERLKSGEGIKLPLVFYIVRHGQAYHNKTKWDPTTDTGLTTDGQMQAENAGKALLDIMHEYKEIPKVLFVSDLRRTHQTMNHLIMNAMRKADRIQSPYLSYLKKLDGTRQPGGIGDTFIILPCASEISKHAVDGECDRKNAKAYSLMSPGKLALENFSRCSVAMVKSGSDKKCKMEQQHPLNWEYYLSFYGNVVRSERFESLGRLMKGTSRMHCRDTNMLANAVNYLMRYHEPVQTESVPMGSPLSTPFRGGKTRKKRKTRRKKVRVSKHRV